MKTTPRTLTYNGETRTMKEWAEITGLRYMTIYQRKVYRGLSDAESLRPKKLIRHEYKGRQYTRKEIAAMTGLPVNLIGTRFRKGWSTKKVIETPHMQSRRSKPKCKYDCDSCPFPDCVV